jgi:hypothetical protein
VSIADRLNDPLKAESSGKSKSKKNKHSGIIFNLNEIKSTDYLSTALTAVHKGKLSLYKENVKRFIKMLKDSEYPLGSKVDPATLTDEFALFYHSLIKADFKVTDLSIMLETFYFNNYGAFIVHPDIFKEGENTEATTITLLHLTKAWTLAKKSKNYTLPQWANKLSFVGELKTIVFIADTPKYFINALAVTKKPYAVVMYRFWELLFPGLHHGIDYETLTGVINTVSTYSDFKNHLLLWTNNTKNNNFALNNPFNKGFAKTIKQYEEGMEASTYDEITELQAVFRDLQKQFKKILKTKISYVNAKGKSKTVDKVNGKILNRVQITLAELGTLNDPYSNPDRLTMTVPSQSEAYEEFILACVVGFGTPFVSFGFNSKLLSISTYVKELNFIPKEITEDSLTQQGVYFPLDYIPVNLKVFIPNELMEHEPIHKFIQTDIDTLFMLVACFKNVKIPSLWEYINDRIPLKELEKVLPNYFKNVKVIEKDLSKIKAKDSTNTTMEEFKELVYDLIQDTLGVSMDAIEAFVDFDEDFNMIVDNHELGFAFQKETGYTLNDYYNLIDEVRDLVQDELINLQNKEVDESEEYVIGKVKNSGVKKNKFVLNLYSVMFI